MQVSINEVPQELDVYIYIYNYIDIDIDIDIDSTEGFLDKFYHNV